MDNALRICTAAALKQETIILGSLSSALAGMVQVAFLLMAFAAVLFLTYYSTKWLARARAGGMTSTGKKKNIQIIEAMPIGLQSSIQLVKVGNQFFLLATAKDKVTFLSEVDGEGINIEEIQDNRLNFEDYLADYFKKFKKKN